jgi:hypothetical protein
MIFVYGNCTITWAIASTHSTAAFTTPAAGAGLTSGRSGAGQGFTWDVGTQALSTTVTLTGTITNALDATAVQGGIGMFNVQGLPAGTLVTMGGVSQRLVAGERGELNAIVLPQIASNTLTVTLTNDVNGSPSIASGASFYIGQIYTGRSIQLPTLVDNSPTASTFDPTAFNRAGGMQLYQNMRKGARQYSNAIGVFNTTDARGGASGTLYNGNLSTGKMDLQFLRWYLQTSPLCMVCDAPHAGFDQRPAAVGAGLLRYNQAFMQNNFMIARMTAAGDIAMSKPPYWAWSGSQFQEAI